jgi:hypothetical protein
MKHRNALAVTTVMILLAPFLMGGTTCSVSSNNNDDDTEEPAIVVNSLADDAIPSPGTITLRSALAAAKSNQRIVFDENLDGETIALRNVAEEHTVLKGEVMGIAIEESGPVSFLVGYFDRDYGRSALYARKNVYIDASALPAGITIAWTGAPGNDARVLAVYGDLTLNNVSITGGRSVTEDISTADPDDQPWTLARGGGAAVWGIARLFDSRIYDNHTEGDFDSSRDRGSFGGGLYADIVLIEDSVISGNTVLGAGAAGGGVYAVGGAEEQTSVSRVARSAISGNRISGLFVYGAGVYTDGGGIGNRKKLEISNSTIARNLAEPAPGLPGFLLSIGFWRGGGVYMSNGFLDIRNCTIVENQVHGVARTGDLGKPNLAGGIAATIGNAHGVEDFVLGQSIVAGNTVHEIGGDVYAHDVFTGSLFYFKSLGDNRIGVIDFSQILVPVGVEGWASLSRKHYPKVNDEEEVGVGEVVDLGAGVTTSSTIVSAGTDAGSLAALHYRPIGSALDQVPDFPFSVDYVIADYQIAFGVENDFLEIILARIESFYGLAGFAAAFTADFEAFLQSVDSDDETVGVQPYEDPVGDPILTLADTGWFGPAVTWPKELENYPYIEFWHRLDDALLTEGIPGLGPETIGDDAWASLFSTGPLVENPSINLRINTRDSFLVSSQNLDQLGTRRLINGLRDIGSIEIP